MSELVRCYMKPYIQPFERSLALAELASLSGAEPHPTKENDHKSTEYLVESALAGCHGIGLDMNPLSVFMGRTKCAVLSADPQEIIEAHNAIRARLDAANPSQEELRYFTTLPKLDQDYLANWFSPKALSELDCITQAISEYDVSPAARDLMRLSLSNIIRGASWQKATDLRVRKEFRPDEEIHPISDFLEEFGRAVKTVVSCTYQSRGLELGSSNLQEDDARQLPRVWEQWRSQVDAVI